MSAPNKIQKVTVPALLQKKRAGERITALTAYDYPIARIVDSAGIDVILVGDSVGMVVLGYENTIPVTMEEMIHHAKAVVRGTKRALPSDLPEWKHLDWNAPLWAIRHFAEDVPGDKRTTGAVFVLKPNGRQVAELTYLSTDPDAVAQAKQRWVHPETDFRPAVRKGAAGTTLITFPLRDDTLSPIEQLVLAFGLHLHR